MWHDVKRSCFDDKMCWFSVLRRALFDYILYRGVRGWREDWLSARDFIFNDICYDGGDPADARSNPDARGFTFEQICGMFGWDADYLRRLARQSDKSNIKKLDSGKYRDLFVPDITDFAMSMSVMWSCGVPASFMTKRQYLKPYRGPFTLRSVPLKLSITRAPNVKWSIAA